MFYDGLSNLIPAIASGVTSKFLTNYITQDENEAVPFNMAEEDFQLPAKVIPEPYLKNLSEEDRKYIDFSGTHNKFISVPNIDEESHWKLKGSEKMKWFENPQHSKTSNEKPTRKSDFKAKSFDINESSNDSTNGTPRVIRQYGKAGEVSSGNYHVSRSYLTALSSISFYYRLERLNEFHSVRQQIL